MVRAKVFWRWALMFACVASVETAGPMADIQLLDAVKRGDHAAVRALLDRRADVNAADVDGTTALHWAAHRDDVESAELLLGSGANVNAANRYGVAPISLACLNGNAAMVERLLKSGADPQPAQGDPPVMTAARTGSVPIVRALAAAQKALTIPRAAVTRIDGKSMVFVMHDKNTVEPRAVTTGPEDAERIAVHEGLRENDRIVLGGMFALKSEIFR